MAGVPYGMIIGGAMDTIGTALIAGGASKRRKQAMELANTPGLDFNQLTGDALSGYESYLPRASALSGKIGLANQQALGAMEESALPGLQAARQKALGKISGLFDEDSAWLKGLQRRGAALGLSSGLAGSQAGQLQTLRLSDQEGMQRTQLGTGLLGSLIGSMRIASTPGAQAFLGPSISDQIATRSQERSKRLDMMAAAQGMPTGSEVWAQRLQQVGTTLAGASSGTTPLGSGYAGGGRQFTLGDYQQQQNMMSEYGGGGGGMLNNAGMISNFSSGIGGFGGA